MQVYYHKYKALNEYSNVLPTASIMSILDGAVLYFSSSTVIDTQRASAFKSAKLFSLKKHENTLFSVLAMIIILSMCFRVASHRDMCTYQK